MAAILPALLSPPVGAPLGPPVVLPSALRALRPITVLYLVAEHIDYFFIVDNRMHVGLVLTNQFSLAVIALLLIDGLLQRTRLVTCHIQYSQ
jgi:hypothetical protein